MLSSVTNALLIGQTSVTEVHALLGTNYAPARLLRGEKPSGMDFLSDVVERHEMTYYLGRRELSSFETEYACLCLDFGEGVLTNVMYYRISF